MGKNSILNKEQKIIFSEVKKSKFLTENFYFSGGTALSEVYLQHRESVDLDFFSEHEYDSSSIFNWRKWKK